MPRRSQLTAGVQGAARAQAQGLAGQQGGEPGDGAEVQPGMELIDGAGASAGAAERRELR